MEKLISAEELENFAYLNSDVCGRPIKGVVVYFNGCGTQPFQWEHTEAGKAFGEIGILYVIPYSNPWSWMNSQAVSYVDDVLDALFEKFSLPEDTPIVFSGRSMGGLAALVYTVYSKRKPCGCAVDCPVCDLPREFEDRNDLRRTIYSAFYNEDGKIEDAMKKSSPMHLAERYPDVPYVIYHCTEDKAVIMDRHSVLFAEKMKKLGKNIKLVRIPGKGHCDLSEEDRKNFRAERERMIADAGADRFRT